MARTTSTFFKDPDATVDFIFDWKARTNGNGDSDWLATGETITTQTVTADDGIDVEGEIVLDDTAVAVWVTGGTSGEDYSVTNRVTTSAGRTDERRITIRVWER